jgi:hypothetical protein
MVVKFRTKYADGYNHPFIVISLSWSRPTIAESEIVKWLHDTFGKSGDRWVLKWDGWGFKYEADRNWFLMRWS